MKYSYNVYLPDDTRTEMGVHYLRVDHSRYLLARALFAYLIMLNK